jgi:hypothetical protein
LDRDGLVSVQVERFGEGGVAIAELACCVYPEDELVGDLNKRFVKI